jgi:hypothetical protein
MGAAPTGAPPAYADINTTGSPILRFLYLQGLLTSSRHNPEIGIVPMSA